MQLHTDITVPLLSHLRQHA